MRYERGRGAGPGESAPRSLVEVLLRRVVEKAAHASPLLPISERAPNRLICPGLRARPRPHTTPHASQESCPGVTATACAINVSFNQTKYYIYMGLYWQERTVLVHYCDKQGMLSVQ